MKHIKLDSIYVFFYLIIILLLVYCMNLLILICGIVIMNVFFY